MLLLTLLTLTLSALPTALTTALPYVTSPYSPQKCQSTITKKRRRLLLQRLQLHRQLQVARLPNNAWFGMVLQLRKCRGAAAVYWAGSEWVV